MGLNPRQRRNRARFLEEQARLRIVIPPNSAASPQRTRTPPPPHVAGDDATQRTPPMELTTSCAQSPLGLTPKGRFPLPPPSSESPRKLHTVPDQESYHKTRQYAVAKFFRDFRTYFKKDPRRNLLSKYKFLPSNLGLADNHQPEDNCNTGARGPGFDSQHREPTHDMLIDFTY